MRFLVANLDPQIHPLGARHRAILAEVGAELIELQCVAEDEIITFAKDADAVLAACANVTGRVIENLPNCKVIGRFGAGTDNVDCETATRRSIPVVYVPDFCTEEVSNHALMLILACSRQLLVRDRDVRSNRWEESRLVLFHEITDQTLGLVGFGRIGQCLASKAIALGMKVMAYDPVVNNAVYAELGVEQVDLEELLLRSDYVSLHVPLLRDTRALMGVEQFRMMKRSAFLVNCARGGVVDQQALVEALRQKEIAGAALDCLADEPPSPDNPLFEMDNVILTPHIAASSQSAVEYLREKTVQQVADVLIGRTPEFVCNRKVFARC